MTAQSDLYTANVSLAAARAESMEALHVIAARLSERLAGIGGFDSTRFLDYASDGLTDGCEPARDYIDGLEQAAGYEASRERIADLQDYRGRS